MSRKPKIILKGRIIEESDFWVTILLNNSGTILEILKKDIEIINEKSN